MVESEKKETSLELENVLESFPQFTKILSQIEELKANLQTSIQHVRTLKKEVEKELKKNENKRKKNLKKKKRAPSGFAKPTVISDELCSFLGKPAGSEMARTEVTKCLTTYIKEHNLQHKENKRRIIPDKKLTKLLNIKKNDEITYFNLQKYMKIHFPKTKKTNVI